MWCRVGTGQGEDYLNPADTRGKRSRAAIVRSDDPDTGETYYRHWLATLESLVAQKGIADRQALARYREAWRRAAARTPHGQPIELIPDDING